MSVGSNVGFWSYTHRDNDLDHGCVGRLAQDVADEFELQTGDSLKMFVDSHSINWGDDWQQDISHALVDTVFFIAVITPLYLRSIACREEFLEFASHLNVRSPKRILLPILYSDTPAVFDSNGRYRVAQIVRQTQYQDWRSLRLSEKSSSEYRRAVHSMAIRIIDICQPGR